MHAVGKLSWKKKPEKKILVKLIKQFFAQITGQSL